MRPGFGNAGKAAHDNIFGLYDPLGPASEPDEKCSKVNPNLSRLHSYPFEKLRKLFEGITPPA
ncbi:MAG: hypothetical protein M0P63_20730, partial [Azoarcus sp.]|nr:hypothetical protein [Azoarcus sp.]